MKIVYIGPFAHGEIDGRPFRRGIAVSISEDIARKVLEEQSEQWVDEGNPLADEAAEAAAALIAKQNEEAEYLRDTGKN